MDEEERRERVSRLKTMLESGVEGLREDAAWRRWLEAQAKFHNYSFGNAMLILMQRPDATLVAGYRTWQELGRNVKRGEKGIAILAPVTYRKREREEVRAEERPSGPSGKLSGRYGREEEVRAEDGDEWAGEEEPARVAVAFRTVYVFDVSQTEGKPLPEPPVQTLEGHSQAADRLYRDLLHIAQEEGIGVYTVPELGGAHGVWRPEERSILLLASDPPDQRAKTLAHELAHAWLHPAGYPYAAQRDRAETEAESVAYIVSAARGLDTSRYSFGYVLGWAKDAKLVRESGERIQAVAERMIGRLEELERAKERGRDGRQESRGRTVVRRAREAEAVMER